MGIAKNKLSGSITGAAQNAAPFFLLQKNFSPNLV
jgi:hypothetical protein